MTKYVACRRRKKVYHTDKDCPNLSKAKHVEETTEEMVDRRDLELCGTCEGEHDVTAYDNSYQQALQRAAGGDD